MDERQAEHELRATLEQVQEAFRGLRDLLVEGDEGSTLLARIAQLEKENAELGQQVHLLEPLAAPMTVSVELPEHLTECPSCHYRWRGDNSALVLARDNAIEALEQKRGAHLVDAKALGEAYIRIEELEGDVTDLNELITSKQLGGGLVETLGKDDD